MKRVTKICFWNSECFTKKWCKHFNKLKTWLSSLRDSKYYGASYTLIFQFQLSHFLCMYTWTVLPNTHQGSLPAKNGLSTLPTGIKETQKKWKRLWGQIFQKVSNFWDYLELYQNIWRAQAKQGLLLLAVCASSGGLSSKVSNRVLWNLISFVLKLFTQHFPSFNLISTESAGALQSCPTRGAQALLDFTCGQGLTFEDWNNRAETSALFG